MVHAREELETRLKAAEAKLVQAEQEKARLEKEHEGEQILLAAMAGEQVSLYRGYSVINLAHLIAERAAKAEARLAAQEATIRQVAQEMRDRSEKIRQRAKGALSSEAKDGLMAYADAVSAWADTLQAITGETQERKTDVDDRKTRPRMTYETDAHCRRCANLRERHPVRMNLGDDPLGQTECAEFVPWPDAETKGEP